MRIGPPKELGWPNPMSSIRMTSTFGAPDGALTSNLDGAVAFGRQAPCFSGIAAPGWAALCGPVMPAPRLLRRTLHRGQGRKLSVRLFFS